MRCISVTGFFQMQTSEWKIKPYSVISRMMSPRKSLMPIKPSRDFMAGKFMQWMDTSRPGMMTRYSSATR